MKKDADKHAKKANKDWAHDWCKEHINELVMHQSQIVLLHPSLGILFNGNTLIELIPLMYALRRSIRNKAAFIDVNVMLRHCGWADPLVDVIDNMKERRERHRMRRKEEDEQGHVWRKPDRKPNDPPEPVPQWPPAAGGFHGLP